MALRMLAAGDYLWTSDADPIRYYRLPIIGWLYRRRVARCIDLLPPGERVLELGYGSGVSFLGLAERFDEIHGLDVHDHANEVAQSFEASGIRPRLHLRQGTITALPYEDDSFDSAVAISIHEELPLNQQDAAFREVLRVLRPGGCYVVGVPGVNVLMNTALYALGCNIGEYHVTTDRQVLEAMRRLFDVQSVRYTPWLLPSSLTTYVFIRGWKRTCRN